MRVGVQPVRLVAGQPVVLWVPPAFSGRSFAKDTEASPCGEEFGEIARHRRLRRFSGVPKIAQTSAYGAISVILPENPQPLGLAGGAR